MNLFWLLLLLIFVSFIFGVWIGLRFTRGNKIETFWEQLNHEVRHRIMLGRNISEMIDMKKLSKSDREFVVNAEKALEEVGPVMEKLETRFR